MNQSVYVHEVWIEYELHKTRIVSIRFIDRNYADVRVIHITSRPIPVAYMSCLSFKQPVKKAVMTNEFNLILHGIIGYGAYSRRYL